MAAGSFPGDGSLYLTLTMRTALPTLPRMVRDRVPSDTVFPVTVTDPTPIGKRRFSPLAVISTVTSNALVGGLAAVLAESGPSKSSSIRLPAGTTLADSSLGPARFELLVTTKSVKFAAALPSRSSRTFPLVGLA